MARMVATLTFEMRGLDECRASMQTVSESAENASLDWHGVEVEDGGSLSFEGMVIAAMRVIWEGDSCILEVKPSASMILFAGSFMTMLPARASVKWRDGWPHFYCPPNDDRDVEFDPTPLVPNELVPA